MKCLPLVFALVAQPALGRAQTPPPAHPAPPTQGPRPPTEPGAAQGRSAVVPPAVPVEPRPPYRETHPSAIYGEVMGKGLVYSVGFDYAIRRFIGAGVSVSYYDPAVFVSPYVNIYPVGSTRSALLLQAGLQLVSMDRSSNDHLEELIWPDDGLDVGGQVSVGYEYRTTFLLRVALLGMFNRHGFLPWFGLTFGGAF